MVSVKRCVSILWNDLSVGKATTIVVEIGDWDYCGYY